MGKVKDKDKEGVAASAPKAPKPAKGKASGKPQGRFAQFVFNLGRASTYKPMQGWYARTYTAVGLGVVVGLGILRLHETVRDARPATRFGVPAAVGAVLGWFIFRLIQYPPFVEFLIATEAEMNKVSWTTRDDLYRATSVVLTTVLLMAVFLFGVDWVWSNLLQLLGVLRFGGGGAFGSNAG
jgi:preprotein translocase subunit SecE